MFRTKVKILKSGNIVLQQKDNIYGPLLSRFTIRFSRAVVESLSKSYSKKKKQA